MRKELWSRLAIWALLAFGAVLGWIGTGVIERLDALEPKVYKHENVMEQCADKIDRLEGKIDHLIDMHMSK